MNKDFPSHLGSSLAFCSITSSSSAPLFQPTPNLLDAIDHGDARTVRYSLAGYHRCLCTWCDREENTLLHRAAAIAAPDCLTAVLQSQIRFTFSQNVHGDTPLHVAARCAEAIVSILVLVAKYGAEPCVNACGETFLHCLVANERLGAEQLTILMESLAERDDVVEQLNLVDAQRMTVYDVASHWHPRCGELREALLRRGAVSAALIFHDEVGTLVSGEEEARASVCAAEQLAYDSVRESEAGERALHRKHHHERRKLAEKERQRRVDQEEEAAAHAALVAKRQRAAQRLAERRANRERCAATLQRVGRGFLGRRTVQHAATLRRVARLVAKEEAAAARLAVRERWAVAVLVLERDAELGMLVLAEEAAATMLNLATEAKAEAYSLRRAAALRDVRTMHSDPCEAPAELAPPPPYELPLCDLPERLLVHLQAVARMRKAVRGYRHLRAMTVVVQRAWRRHHNRVVLKRRSAADLIVAGLCRHQFNRECHAVAEHLMLRRIRAMIGEVTRLVTQLVWRENFCTIFREIAFLQRRRKAPPAPRLTRFRRLQRLAVELERFVLLTQFLISLFLLIYMGCAPRTRVAQVHNKVDIAFICVQVVVACSLPLRWWRLWDAAVVVTALVCAAASRYGGAIVITLFTLKLPFLVRLFAPRHSGTRTYCRCIEYSAVYMLLFAPFALGGIGATVRGTAVNELLLTSDGNWGRVFLWLLSTSSPQFTELLLGDGSGEVGGATAPRPLRSEKSAYVLPDGRTLLRFQVPLVQLLVFRMFMFLYCWSVALVGTHNAIRHHYDISDETKLKLNKHRFRNEGKEELFDAHRAANIEALGQQLDGVMWEDDVRAAKEAVDASHYDHNTDITVHRFVRRVQDTLGNQGGYGVLAGPQQPLPLRTGTAGAKPATREAGKWDCRNEDPQSRGKYDVEVVETALGLTERKGAGERFIERQWTGGLLRKEMNWVLMGMLVMASVKPNLLAMEVAFSAVFAVELVASLYFLRLEFIFSHHVRLLLRLFCVVIGFVPPGIPFVAFRSLRLVEGWSLLFSIPGMVRWGMLYLVASFVTIWMIAYVAALQFLAATALTGRPSLCSNRGDCLAISLRELVLPAFTPTHIDVSREAPVMALLVLFTHFFFAPFVLAITLHPLLRLSNFIGRFLRLVVQSLHKDVVDYLENYLEGASWYTHWGLKSGVSVGVVVRLKLWLNDMRRRRITAVWDMSRSSSSVMMNLYTLQKTFVKGYEPEPEETYTVLTEIICRGEFASFKENNEQDRFRRNLVQQRLSRIVVRNVLVHYFNVLLTFASIAFLWAADASLERGSGVVIASCVVHLLSAGVSVVVIPHDSTAVTTVVSAGALLCAVVLVLLPGHAYRSYYCVRFLSLLRIGQLQVFPFRESKRVVKLYIDSVIKIVFPVAVIGGAAYIAELLRAQIVMVQYTAKPWMNINWSDPGEVAALRANVSYTEYLAAYPRSHTSRPNVAQTSDLFAAYFADDAYIFYSIFFFWVLPGMCISTCLSYLFGVGANVRDTNRLLVDMIPLLEDPITTAAFSWYQWLYRYAGNVVLIVSLAFGCIFSPSTNATSDDHNFFFGFEVGFTVCGLVEAVMSCSFAVHRCARSSVSWRGCEGNAKHRYVLFGDCVFLLCEVVQLLYYCIAAALCATLLVERRACLILPDEYAIYFVTVRFVFLLRLLGREFLLALMRNLLPVCCSTAGLIVYYVVSASALADVYASETRTSFTPTTWRAAFDAILRLTLTASIPADFYDYWQPFNGTAAAAAMENSSKNYFVVAETYATSRLAFVLAVFGIAIVASVVGLLIGAVAVPMRTTFLQPLPAKSLLLYRTLCGGLHSLVRFGERNHDDMRPHTRRRIQARKFTRMFTQEGIPSWAVPHLLEELDICRPARQRRFMYALMRLLEYLPVSERRQTRVREFMHMWECYRCGGPARLRFSQLPVYPPAEPPRTAQNPYYAAPPTATMRRDSYIAPLRLVQALAIFELGFPADSSVGSKLWMDFFSVVQKMRGATLMQSLWRMYREEKAFDADTARTAYDRGLIAYLRRGFRKQKLRSNIGFLSFASFQEAIKFEHKALNPNTGHFDVLNRLRGHFTSLNVAPDFWKLARSADGTKPTV